MVVPRKTHYYEELGLESAIAPSIYSPDDVNLKVTIISKENDWGLDALVMNAPIWGAAMDTVTAGIDVRQEYAKFDGINIDAAKIINQHGGIPVFPRSKYITPKVQNKMFQIYHRSSSHCINDPVTITKDLTISDVLKLRQETGYKSFPVLDGEGHLEGMLCSRDYKRAQLDAKVSKRMTVRDDLIVGPPGIGWQEAFKILNESSPRVEKLPLVDENDIFKGMTTIQDAASRYDYPNVMLDSNGNYIGFVAIGTVIEKDIIEQYVNNGVNGFMIDSSVGRSKAVGDAVRKLDNILVEKLNRPLPIGAGNVIGKSDAKYLVDCGTHILKSGYALGFTCDSGNVTGTAKGGKETNEDVAEVCDEAGVAFISDGGFRVSAHAIYAGFCGASSVMLGKVIAEGVEAPVITPLKEAIPGTGFYLKVYRGMGDEELIGDYNRYQSKVPEGSRTLIPIRGSLHEILSMFLRGMQSGISEKGLGSWNNLIEEHKRDEPRLWFNTVLSEKKHAEGPLEKIPLNAALKF